MHQSGYPMNRKCGNPDCPDCYPERWPDRDVDGTTWAWPWGIALFLLLAGWAVWFVTSGAVRP